MKKNALHIVLKPCPICGNPEPVINWYGVSCMKCGLFLSNTRSSDAESSLNKDYLERWNMRYNEGDE